MINTGNIFGAVVDIPRPMVNDLKNIVLDLLLCAEDGSGLIAEKITSLGMLLGVYDMTGIRSIRL